MGEPLSFQFAQILDEFKSDAEAEADWKCLDYNLKCLVFVKILAYKGCKA